MKLLGIDRLFFNSLYWIASMTYSVMYRFDFRNFAAILMISFLQWLFISMSDFCKYNRLHTKWSIRLLPNSSKKLLLSPGARPSELSLYLPLPPPPHTYSTSNSKMSNQKLFASSDVANVQVSGEAAPEEECWYAKNHSSMSYEPIFVEKAS